MRTSTRAMRRAVTVVAVAAVAAVACTNVPANIPRPPNGPIDTPYAVTCDGSMPGMDHGDGGMDHNDGGGGMGGHMDMPARLNHAPCEAQKVAARQLIADTRAAVKRLNQGTVAGLRAQGFFSIGDEITGTTHYVKPALRNDAYNLDPNRIEEFAIRGGRVIAAMYTLGVGYTMDNVPDIAGNWTMWHSHLLAWQSNNPNSTGYYKLFGAFTRTEPPMLHVWLQDNNLCGPFAGTDAVSMTGSCNGNIG